MEKHKFLINLNKPQSKMKKLIFVAVLMSLITFAGCGDRSTNVYPEPTTPRNPAPPGGGETCIRDQWDIELDYVTYSSVSCPVGSNSYYNSPVYNGVSGNSISNPFHSEGKTGHLIIKASYEAGMFDTVEGKFRLSFRIENISAPNYSVEEYGYTYLDKSKNWCNGGPWIIGNATDEITLQGTQADTYGTCNQQLETEWHRIHFVNFHPTINAKYKVTITGKSPYGTIPTSVYYFEVAPYDI